jgi:aspartate/methionine/tyrosine aminotransferase
MILAAFQLNNAEQETLKQWQSELTQQFQAFKAEGLNLDLTRGKPSADQLTLSNSLDGILAGNYIAGDGTDTRNYGGLDGLSEAKALFAKVLEVEPGNILIGGNSSLTLMYQSILFAYLFGFDGADSAWQKQGTVKFICPVPGYDRHFSICEEFGIEMITVTMDENGPDMDAVEALIKSDSSIRGLWCVPRFSNPTGIVYSDEVVERIAKLGLIADKSFRVFWDNAYAVHHIENSAPALAPIANYCAKHGTENNVIQFGSTSKVTMAGAGVAFMSSSSNNLNAFKQHLGMSSIGPDKINQLRHIAFFKDEAGLQAHMQKHADLLKPRFDAVLNCLNNHFTESDALSWTVPEGGYFVSVDTQDGLAQQVVTMAAECGVKLTPAGATFPYGKDPSDKNIRLAPSFPTVADISQAMEIFACCVKLASVNKVLG